MIFFENIETRALCRCRKHCSQTTEMLARQRQEQQQQRQCATGATVLVPLHDTPLTVMSGAYRLVAAAAAAPQYTRQGRVCLYNVYAAKCMQREAEVLRCIAAAATT